MVELPADYNKMSTRQRIEVRNQYVDLQEGCCYHCKSPLAKDPPKRILNKNIKWRLFPSGFLQYPVHLHHNHKTGMTIGAVHAYCNAVLWQYYGE